MNKLYFPPACWCDGMIIESCGRFAVIDTQYLGCGERITSVLKRCGVEKLEFIIITHYHNDHYGSCIEFIKEYPTDKVYVKGYSGKDATDGNGDPFTDEGRRGAWAEYTAFLDEIKKYSTLCMIYPEMGDLHLGEMTLKLYNTDNMIEKLYCDPVENEYFGKYVFNENTNSIAVYIECENGASAFITGDCIDDPVTYAPARNVMTRSAEFIGHKIDVYKVPHHGCGDHTSETTARLLCPDFVVTTNTWIDENSARKLKEANPEAEMIFCTRGVHEFLLNGAGDVVYTYVE